MTLDRFYPIESIEMVVAHSPAGKTSHEIWEGDASGTLTKLREYIDVPTSDVQIFNLPVNPPLVLDRVTVLTTKSTSWIAWREIRVLGVPIPQPLAEGSSGFAARQLTDWPRINLPGNLESRVQITNAADGSGRIFVVEQKGRIRVLSDEGLLPTALFDISEHVSCCGEQGLLSVAFPPEFAKKWYFYVNHTNTEGNTVIARNRLSIDPNVADPQSAETILRIDQPHFSHNGGHMEFGPKDGYLYIGTGDGGPGGDP